MWNNDKWGTRKKRLWGLRELVRYKETMMDKEKDGDLERIEAGSIELAKNCLDIHITEVKDSNFDSPIELYSTRLLSLTI